MNKKEKTRLNRILLKEIPKVHLDEILEQIGCVGIEADIARSRIIDKKSPLEICEDLCISESTYYRHFNNILSKVYNLLRLCD